MFKVSTLPNQAGLGLGVRVRDRMRYETEMKEKFQTDFKMTTNTES